MALARQSSKIPRSLHFGSMPVVASLTLNCYECKDFSLLLILLLLVPLTVHTYLFIKLFSVKPLEGVIFSLLVSWLVYRPSQRFLLIPGSLMITCSLLPRHSCIFIDLNKKQPIYWFLNKQKFKNFESFMSIVEFTGKLGPMGNGQITCHTFNNLKIHIRHI